MSKKRNQSKRSRARLQVRREVLRNLSVEDLSKAQGGADLLGALLGVPLYHNTFLMGPCRQSQ